MYQIGDYIVYGNEGVCRVDGIAPFHIPGMTEERLYYTLTPLYHDEKIYTPVDTEVFMRPVISREEAIELIATIPGIEAEAYENKNLRFSNEQYEESFQSHDCADLLRVIKAVYIKRCSANERGRKLGQIDERYMKRAEDRLHEEFAVALGIPKDEVREYIRKAVGGEEET